MKRERSCQSIAFPVGLVALSILTILLVFTRPDTSPQAAELQQNNPTQTYTFTPSNTATQYYTPPPQTATRTNTPTYTNTPEHTNTSTSTNTPNDNDNDDPEPTATEEDEPEENTPTDTPTPPEDTKTPTYTNTPIPEIDNRDCFLAHTIIIEPRMQKEYAPPQTHLLIFFRGRAVGGAVSDRTGFYHARLTIGDEMTGDIFRAIGEGAPEIQEGDLQYPLEIRIRETRELVHTVVCNMWAVTHTPTIPVIPTRQDMP